MQKKVLYNITIIVFLALIATSIASAGLFDWVTGRASQPTNISIPVAGSNPAEIVYVSSISATNPTENSATAITFEVHMSDADGVDDLNDTSVSANFSQSGETTRTTSSCPHQNDIDTTTANYSCSIDMWYWDSSGAWNVNVQGKDVGNITWAYNQTTNFTYNELQALVISPATVTWANIYTGAANQNASNDPTYINNTGNYNSTVTLTAIDLIGETTATSKLPANNFTAGVSSGTECSGDAQVNATAVTITNSNANRGNLSAGSGAGQETFYYCIPSVPNLPSQTYSTTAGGAWTIAYGGGGGGTQVGLDLIYPTTDIYVNRFSFFNVTVNVSCSNPDCGEISVSLDPITPGCDPDNSDCTSICSQIYYPGYYVEPWISGGQCVDTNDTARIRRDAECDGYAVYGDGADCAEYFDRLATYDQYFCPSYNRKGGVVTSSDCNCLQNQGSCNIPYSSIFNFSSDFFTTGMNAVKGLINTTEGATPFYTNESNPRTVSLNATESQIVTFWVNATGPKTSYTFYAYANKTADATINDITSTWLVTIQ